MDPSSKFNICEFKSIDLCVCLLFLGENTLGSILGKQRTSVNRGLKRRKERVSEQEGKRMS